MESEEGIQCKILPDDFSQYDLSFKLIVIGDSGVGKSCLTMKAIKNQFESNYPTTVGFEFFTFNVKINDKNKTANLGHIWSGDIQKPNNKLL
jgi:GTPase SAR1 family protein